MKTLLSVLTAAGMFSAACLNVTATSYSDVDEINQVLNGSTTSFSSTFDIAGGDGDAGDVHGYNPATETVVSGVVIFTLNNAILNRDQVVTIQISGQNWIAGSVLPFGVSVFGDVIDGQGYLDLDATGVASYTITRNSGTFTIKDAQLFVDAAPRALVSDAGATLALLGFGLAGLSLFGRKLKVQKA